MSAPVGIALIAALVCGAVGFAVGHRLGWVHHDRRTRQTRGRGRGAIVVRAGTGPTAAQDLQRQIELNLASNLARRRDYYAWGQVKPIKSVPPRPNPGEPPNPPSDKSPR